MDGAIQVVAMGISIVRLNRVLSLLDGSRICADITECAMPNGDGSLQSFIPSLILPKPNRRVEIGVGGGRCQNWDYQIDYYCGNVLMNTECIPQIAGRDTSEISLSILPEPLDRLNRSHTNRTNDLFYTLPENTIVRAIDSFYIIEPKIVPKRNAPNNPTVDTNASYSVENIFPNPFQDKISVNLNVGSTAEIQFKLVNLLGKVVFEQKQSLSKGFHPIILELPRLAAGVYNLEIVSEDGIQKQVQKLVHL